MEGDERGCEFFFFPTPGGRRRFCLSLSPSPHFKLTPPKKPSPSHSASSSASSPKSSSSSQPDPPPGRRAWGERRASSKRGGAMHCCCCCRRGRLAGIAARQQRSQRGEAQAWLPARAVAALGDIVECVSRDRHLGKMNSERLSPETCQQGSTSHVTIPRARPATHSMCPASPRPERLKLRLSSPDKGSKANARPTAVGLSAVASPRAPGGHACVEPACGPPASAARLPAQPPLTHAAALALATQGWPWLDVDHPLTAWELIVVRRKAALSSLKHQARGPKTKTHSAPRVCIFFFLWAWCVWGGALHFARHLLSQFHAPATPAPPSPSSPPPPP